MDRASAADLLLDVGLHALILVVVVVVGRLLELNLLKPAAASSAATRRHPPRRLQDGSRCDGWAVGGDDAAGSPLCP